MSVTTTASFVIPAVGASVSATLSDTTQTPQYASILIGDGTYAVEMQVTAISSGTACTLETLRILAGSSGNTMGSGANVLLTATKLGSLTTNPSPSLSDTLYIIAGGNSYKATIGAYFGSAAPIATLHTAQQAISSIQHQWRCNDAAGSTSLAASVGSTAMTVTGADMLVGVPGLLTDGASGVRTSYTAGHYLKAASVIPTSGSYSVEFVAHIIVPLNTTTYGICCAQGAGGDGSGALLYYNSNPGSSPYGFAVGNFGVAATYSYVSLIGGPAVFHMETDGSTTYGYVNGELVNGSTDAHYTTPNGDLYVGALSQTQYSGMMFVQNIAVYNARLTAAQKLSNVNAALLR